MADQTPTTSDNDLISGGAAGGRASSGGILGRGDLLEGFSNLNLLRQIGLMVGLAASVALGFAVVLWSQGTDYRPLYSNLDMQDSAEIVQLLEQGGFDFKMDQRSGSLLVASEQIYNARMELASAGLPGDKSVGFELLEQEQPLGTSQFMEGARYRRSLEGELARTIMSIRGVRSARVHLALPKDSVFVRDQRKPTASVFVELYAGRGIERENVEAITNLVAASIPQLTQENVTVVDQRGNLLSKFTQEDAELERASKQLGYARTLEEQLLTRVRGILDPLLGSGNYRAEVAADVDFTEVEQADEQFNPDLPAIRSEQTIDEQRVGDGVVAGIPGALTNQPPGDAAAPEQARAGGAAGGATPSRSRSEATRNYELDRTISYTKHQVGRVRRLSVAVAVDDVSRVNPDSGSLERLAWSEEELERLSALVRNAVGFDAARGDSINVVNTPFLGRTDEVVLDLPFYEQPWFWDAMRQLGGMLFVVLLIFVVLRPVMRSLSSSAQQARELEARRELGELEGDLGDELSDATVTLSAGSNMLLTGPDESYEDQLSAIRGLIAEDPARVAQVIKRWISSGE